MKKITQLFFIPSLLAALLGSCKKEESRVSFTGGTAPVLTSSRADNDTIPLQEADSLSTAIVLSWTNPEYTFSNGPSTYPVSYDIQIDTLGAGFSNAAKGKGVITVNESLGQALTVKALNNVLASASQLGLNSGQTYHIQLRVKSYYSNAGLTPTGGVLALYSDTLNYVVTPYKTSFPMLWVPGDYQGWTPASAPNLALSPFNSTAYEGYINVPSGGTYEFKFTSAPDFSHINYGNPGGETGDATSGGGDLSTDGGAGNLTVPGAGYYRLTADIDNLEWTYTSTAWDVIGSFAASGWSTDVPMTYDADRQEWYAVISFAANDEFKFRANGNYDINFGLDASNNFQYNGGTNMKVPAAGVDTVFLDLHNAGGYTYSVVPQ